MKLKNKADIFFGMIQKIVWVMLSATALYMLLFAAVIYIYPTQTLGLVRHIPYILEHLLAGCVIILGAGALFEYLTSE